MGQQQQQQQDEQELFPLQSIKEFFPTSSLDTLFDREYSALVVSFYKQSLVKQFLTEGEKYMMTLFNILSFGQQGVYDVINNLGSLAARIIFMPIEESYHVFFSQMLTRGKVAREQENDGNVDVVATNLGIVLKGVSTVGLVVLVFGYSYSYLLLQLYGGSMLTENQGPTLLRTYCLYVLVIAVNGITECFMFAVMDEQEISKYNYKMVVFSLIFTLASLLFTSYLGAVGFILANCLNMLLRIVASTRYIRKFFEGTSHTPLRDALPTLPVCMCLVSSFIITSASERRLCCDKGWLNIGIHVGVGVGCLVALLFALVRSEPALKTQLYSFIKRRRQNKQN